MGSGQHNQISGELKRCQGPGAAGERIHGNTGGAVCGDAGGNVRGQQSVRGGAL